MKIHTQLNKMSDNIILSGSILKINGVDYNLDNVKPLPENESCENQRVYLHFEDVIIFLKIDVELQFMFINNNLIRFYDINENDIIDINELKLIVDHWNMSEENRRKEHKTIMNDFLKTHSKEEWKNKGL